METEYIPQSYKYLSEEITLNSSFTLKKSHCELQTTKDIEEDSSKI